jgi:predicted kinase
LDNILVMMIGLSGSGKSYFAQQISQTHNMPIYSSDSLREELYGDAAIQRNQHLLFEELHRRIRAALKRGESLIYDATNINTKHRVAFIKSIRKYVGSIQCVVILTPHEKCIEYDRARGRSVSEAIILKQLKQFQMPAIEEGFDAIEFIMNCEDGSGLMSTIDWINSVKGMPHETPHHKSSIQDHSLRVMNEFTIEYPEATKVEISAALLHDMGKPLAKTFVKPDGTQLDHAIYYNHENIGSYLSMFVSPEFNLVQKWERALIIQHHMRPYFKNGMENVKDLIPIEIYNAVLRLHEIDKRRD